MVAAMPCNQGRTISYMTDRAAIEPPRANIVRIVVKATAPAWVFRSWLKLAVINRNSFQRLIFSHQCGSFCLGHFNPFKVKNIYIKYITKIAQKVNEIIGFLGVFMLIKPKVYHLFRHSGIILCFLRCKLAQNPWIKALGNHDGGDNSQRNNQDDSSFTLKGGQYVASSMSSKCEHSKCCYENYHQQEQGNNQRESVLFDSRMKKPCFSNVF